MTKFVDYEVTLTVRVQGSEIGDVPGLFTEALVDHDLWPVVVTELDSGAPPVEMDIPSPLV